MRSNVVPPGLQSKVKSVGQGPAARRGVAEGFPPPPYHLQDNFGRKTHSELQSDGSGSVAVGSIHQRRTGWMGTNRQARLDKLVPPRLTE